MTDATTSVRVSRGEMNPPWSDASGQSYAAGGPVLEAFVAALPALSGARRVLVAGPHTPQLIAVIRAAATSASVTVLLRSLIDAQTMIATVPEADVIAGSLDGFTEQGPEPYDVIIALDGLDRVRGYDSAPQVWSDTARELFALATTEATVVLAHPYDAAPAALLDARPSARRHADDEMWALRADTTRPVSAADFVRPTSSLTALPLAGAFRLFGPANAPRLLADCVEDVDRAAPDALLSYAITAASSRRTPLLAPADEAIRLLTRGQGPDAAADGGLLVFGDGNLPQAVSYASAGGVLTTARRGAAEREVEIIRAEVLGGDVWPDDSAVEVVATDTAQPSETARYLPVQTAPTRDLDNCLAPDCELIPRTVLLTTTVEDEFIRLAALGDVPGFRELAGSVGRFVADLPIGTGRAIRFDNLHVDGRSFGHGLEGLRWSRTVSTAEALGAAFWLLQDRIRRDDLRHPWPDHVGGEALVALWLGMAGHDEEADSAVPHARTLADALSLPGAFPSGAVPDLRSALTDAATARRELAEAQGQVFGLERTIGFRDKQLRTREDVIRNLRSQRGGGAVTATAPTVGKLVKRASEVRSFGELSAGVNRVLKRAQRNRKKKKT